MKPTPIFISSFFRKDMTKRAIREIHERTAPGSFEIHLYDNGSDQETQDFLIGLLREKKIVSLVLDSRNTGCLYNKGVYHAMTEVDCPYLCVSDNDIYPPKLTPDWLSQVVSIMDRHPEIGMLAPQLPPQWLQEPYQVTEDVVYSKAIGNTLKIIRRSAFPVDTFKPKLGEYGDDGLVSQQMTQRGWKVAFCRSIYCLHAGQCENWGYTPEQVAMDPRKSGYGKPYIYEIKNMDTYEPVDFKLRM
jgi:GT2 family glycosyltransferase